MPKHTRQKNGRLEIRKIGLHEGGLFICKAVGHSNEKGGEEIAQVDVMKLKNHWLFRLFVYIIHSSVNFRHCLPGELFSQ